MQNLAFRTHLHCSQIKRYKIQTNKCSMITHVDKCIKPDEIGRKSQSWISSRIAPLDSTTWHKMYLFIYHMTCRMKSKRSRQLIANVKYFVFLKNDTTPNSTITIQFRAILACNEIREKTA